MPKTAVLAVALLVACQSAPASPSTTNPSERTSPTVSRDLLQNAEGSYGGPNLLWFMDPNKPFESDGEVQVESESLRYTWSFKEKPQSGVMTFAFQEDGVEVEWTDTWHTPEPMRFRGEHQPDAIVVHGTYAAGEGPDWGWRIEIRVPGADELLIEMFNIPPEGPEAIAVRMPAKRS